MAFMAIASFWSFTYLFQLLSVWPSPTFWLKIKYIGVVTLPAAWLVFSFEYIGKKEWVNKLNASLLSVIPIFNIVLIWTNEIHHFFFTEIMFRPHGPFPTKSAISGPLFWLHSVYSYILLIGGSLLILWYLAKVGRFYFKRALIIATGVLVPVVGNAVYIAGFIPLNNFDITPLLFPFAIVAFTWALSRQGFMDLLPIAQEVVFNKIKDSIFVLNDENRVLNANESAKDIAGKYFSISEPGELIGKKAEEIFSNKPELMNNIREKNEARIGIRTDEDGGRYFDVKIDTIEDTRNQLIGQVLLFRDITELEELKENQFLQTLIQQDIKNKIMTSSGFIQLLEDEDLSNEYERYLKKAERINEEARELTELVEESERTRNREELVSVDVIKALRNSISECDDLADEKNVEIDLTSEENRILVLGGHALKKVFPAIIKTRILKSNPTEIRIGVEEEGDEIIVSIEDDGEKLPVELKKSVSEETYTGGTSGLGGSTFFISREIIGYFGGTLKIFDSELGGAGFNIRLKKA